MNPNLDKSTEELDDLDIQISLGEEEYVDAFEEQKTKFLAWAKSSAAAINEQVEKYGVNEKADSLKAKFEELQVQLALGKAESKDAFEGQREKLESSMADCTKAFDEYRESAGDKATEMGNKFQGQIEKFQTKLDVFRMHFALGSADAQDEWKEKKKELQAKVAELKAKATKSGEEASEEAGEKWEEVKAEAAEAYENVKSTLKRFFT